jgi:hypothetical protein
MVALHDRYSKMLKIASTVHFKPDEDKHHSLECLAISLHAAGYKRTLVILKQDDKIKCNEMAGGEWIALDDPLMIDKLDEGVMEWFNFTMSLRFNEPDKAAKRL